MGAVTRQGCLSKCVSPVTDECSKVVQGHHWYKSDSYSEYYFDTFRLLYHLRRTAVPVNFGIGFSCVCTQTLMKNYFCFSVQDDFHSFGPRKAFSLSIFNTHICIWIYFITIYWSFFNPLIWNALLIIFLYILEHFFLFYPNNLSDHSGSWILILKETWYSLPHSNVWFFSFFYLEF